MSRTPEAVDQAYVQGLRDAKALFEEGIFSSEELLREKDALLTKLCKFVHTDTEPRDFSSFVPNAGTDAENLTWYRYADEYTGYEHFPGLHEELARIQAEEDAAIAESANAANAARAHAQLFEAAGDDEYLREVTAWLMQRGAIATEDGAADATGGLPLFP